MILVEKYRPITFDSFIGITEAVQDARDLVAQPASSAWLFVGASGTGKTALAQTIGAALAAEVHLISSQNCTVDTVRALRDRLAYAPMFGASWHLVIVDEADEMSPAAQNAWLSLTDSTNRPEQTIIIFTCNETELPEGVKMKRLRDIIPERLKDRFISRCEVVRFSTYGIAKDTADLLARVWEAETGNAVPAPNFVRIVKEANTNVRESLQVLQRHVRRATRQNTGE